MTPTSVFTAATRGLITAVTITITLGAAAIGRDGDPLTGETKKHSDTSLNQVDDINRLLDRTEERTEALGKILDVIPDSMIPDWLRQDAETARDTLRRQKQQGEESGRGEGGKAWGDGNHEAKRGREEDSGRFFVPTSKDKDKGKEAKNRTKEAGRAAGETGAGREWLSFIPAVGSTKSLAERVPAGIREFRGESR